MISQDFITEWRERAPWLQLYQVEQDLVICRDLVDIFNHPAVRDNLLKVRNFSLKYALKKA
jgi:hypothetical protein